MRMMAALPVLLGVLLLPLASGQMMINSSAFLRFGEMPLEYGCDPVERDIAARPSPPLAWLRAPAQAQSFVLIMDDLDAENVVHWLVKDIPATVESFEADASETNMQGAVELPNSFGTQAYAAPCAINSTHTYRFRLYAMPTTKTDLAISGPVQKSDDIVSQLANDALVSAVVLSNMTIVPPAVLTPKQPTETLSLECDKAGFKTLMARRIDSCSWKHSTQDGSELEFKGTEAITEEGILWRAFTFECKEPGTVTVKITLTCMTPNARASYTPMVVVANIRVKEVEEQETSTNKTDYLPYPELEHDIPTTARYLHPSEVMKPQRPHVVLESDLTPCRGGEGSSECIVDLPAHKSHANAQMLVQTHTRVKEDSNNTDIWTCPELRRHSRGTTDDQGGRCNFHVRLTSMSCNSSRGAQFPASASCDGDAPTSPAVEWKGLPELAKSVAVIMEDVGRGLGAHNETIHWLVVDVDRKTTSIKNGASGTDFMPPLCTEQRNSFGTRGFYPPCGSDKRILRLHAFAMPHARTYVSQRHSSTGLVEHFTKEAVCAASIDMVLHRHVQ